MHSIQNIAAYILNKYEGQITPMKLQKLLYYVHAWSLVAGKQIICSKDGFYAWKHGPVNPEVYHTYKGYKNQPITETPSYEPLNKYEQELADFILESYDAYNAVTLSKTTHIEDPWIKNKDTGGFISDDEMTSFYQNESFAKNFPLYSGTKYYPPKTISHYAYVFDMEKGDAAAEVEFDSIEEYKKLLVETQSIYNKLLQIS